MPAAQGGHKRALYLLELESPMVVSHYVLLGTKPKVVARTASVLYN